jgi:rhomboid protease GluP
MIELGANFPPLTVDGQAWRLVSAMFLHYGLLHLTLNMVCLWQGRLVERLFGHLGFAGIYGLAGLLGSLATVGRDMLLSPKVHGASVGASGAVFGVYGAFGAYLWLQRSNVPAAEWQKTVRQIGSFLGINLFFGLTATGVDVAAHVGGLAGGFVAGIFLLLGTRGDQPSKLRARILVIATAAVVFGTSFAFGRTDVGPAVREFNGVKNRVGDLYNRLIELQKEGTITGERMAQRIEEDVLPPWKTMRGHLDDIPNPPSYAVEPLRLLRQYAASQQTAWEVLVKANRAKGEEQTALGAEYQRAAARADEDGRAYENYSRRLGSSGAAPDAGSDAP